MVKNKKRGESESAFFARWRRQIFYASKNVFLHIRQYFISYFLTCFVISMTVVLPAVTYVIWKNSNIATQEWQPSPNLTLYLSQLITESERKLLTSKLEKNPLIKQVTYMTKEQALAEFSEWSGVQHSLELLESNPLPAVMIVEPDSATYDKTALFELSQTLQENPIIDDIKFDDSWVTRIVMLSHLIKWLVITLSFLMLFALVLVIANNIRFSIFVRRQTIQVMQLLGATDSFILRSFLYYGVMIGALSGLMSLIFTDLIVFQIQKIIFNVSSAFEMNFTLEGLTLFEASSLFIWITFLSAFSAYFTTKRYLNAKSFRQVGI